MDKENMLSVKLHVANSSFYDGGNLVSNWLELPMEEGVLKGKLEEIQNGDDYIVLGADTQFRCTVEEDLDVIKMNRKLNRLSYSDMSALKAISEYDILPLTKIIDIALNKKYVIYEDVKCEEQLGYKLYKEQLLPFDIPAYLERYIDFKALGHEACIKESIHIIPTMHIAERILYTS